MKRLLFSVPLILLLATACNKQSVSQPNQQINNPPPPQQTGQTSQTIDETANWKTYTNTQYGFEFKYPKEYVIKDGDNYATVYDPSRNVGVYGNQSFFIVFISQKTDQPLSQIIKDRTDAYTLSEARSAIINGISAYEGVDLGMVSSYAVFVKNGSTLVEINFNSGNDNGLEKNKAALTGPQKLILSTFKFTK